MTHRNPELPPFSDHNVFDALVAMATAEFAKHGVEGVSMGEIARKCGVTKAALYYYFSSKESLYDEIYHRKLEDIQQQVSDAVSREEHPLNKLEAFSRTLYDCLSKDSTTLLLSLRDIMAPLINQDVKEPSSHFKFYMDGLLPLLSRGGSLFDHNALSLPVAALIFGYCSLTTYDSLTSEDEKEKSRVNKREQMLQNIKTLISGDHKA